MLSLDGIGENFKFIILEVTKQIEDTLKVLEEPNEGPVAKIQSRDDYIDNLKSIIENKCFSNIVKESSGIDKQTVALIRAVNVISNNLEKIADYTVNIVDQTGYYEDPEFIKKFDYISFFNIIFKTLDIIEDALLSRDISMALRICRSEFEMDQLYKENFEKILEDLSHGKDTGNLITTLFIFQYLERAGDALLNIGEAIIFSVVGEKLKIEQYQALEDSLALSSDEDVNINTLNDKAVNMQAFWGRSGCRIGKLDKVTDGKETEVIFKEGVYEKIIKEKENLDRWDSLAPGLPPKLYNFQRNGDHASILVECLTGSTFQQLILTSEIKLVEYVFNLVKDNANKIWTKSKTDEKCDAEFLAQLHSRRNDVYKVHPEFKTPMLQIGNLKALSFDALLDKAKPITAEIKAPFSVFIHGDFNIDNIIFDHDHNLLHYIDVYRSKQFDYVQDVSVFIVSNYRLPVFDPAIRHRLNQISIGFYRFARKFAHQNNDDLFEVRLALGLIRSFFTSTRFQFNVDFAKSMYMRSIYLLEKLIDHHEEGKDWSKFILPEDVLVS